MRGPLRAQTLAQDFEIDYLCLSYVRSEDDIHEARAWLSSVGLRNTRLLAKIETRQSLLNFEAILSVADGIVISRGASINSTREGSTTGLAGQSAAGGLTRAAPPSCLSRAAPPPAGNLGLDCPPEKMAMVQKTLIHGCNMAGKPVLITRVVDTMVSRAGRQRSLTPRHSRRATLNGACFA